MSKNTWSRRGFRPARGRGEQHKPLPQKEKTPAPAAKAGNGTQAVRAADIPGVPEFVEEGALLGELWMEGRFGVGDPLVRSGAPLARQRAR